MVGHVAIADDGTGNQLREHGDIQHEVGELLHRLVHATVGVQGVGDALEREERDADGQHDAFPGEGRVSREAEDGIQVFHREVAVFVEHEQPDGDDDRQAAKQFLQAFLLGLAHPFDQEEVGHRGGDELEDEFIYFKVAQISRYIVSTGSEDYFNKAKEEFGNMEIKNEKSIKAKYLKIYHDVLESGSYREFLDRSDNKNHNKKSTSFNRIFKFFRDFKF